MYCDLVCYWLARWGTTGWMGWARERWDVRSIWCEGHPEKRRGRVMPAGCLVQCLWPCQREYGRCERAILLTREQ